MPPLILASSSPTRAALLRQAELDFEVVAARLDEAAIRESLLAEGASARDIADALAEQKALRVARSRPEALVLGCDQILALNGEVLGKPDSVSAARERLFLLRGKSHELMTAAVLYADGAPIWRHDSTARMKMRTFSDGFLDAYLDHLGPDVCDTAGAYKIEGLGVRLFDDIQGDFFGILGLPLTELLNVLTRRGDISS